MKYFCCCDDFVKDRKFKPLANYFSSLLDKYNKVQNTVLVAKVIVFSVST